ncbi:hypothetical protein PV327_011273 [Microctonus hyperodae]|nr:hypothetical protein PV327_011273 [Microctonus hyperodae]
MPKIKQHNLQITKNEKGTEIIRFKGKFTKQYKVERYLRAKLRNQLQKGKNVSTSNDKDIPVDGERVIDLKAMAKKMFCEKCEDKFSLCDIQGETVQGLGSIFDVKCSKCNHVTKVHSSEKYINPVTGKSSFAINIKVALGALNSGLGPTKTNKFLKTVGLPGVNEKTFKVHERLVGPIIEQIARDSCIEAVTVEKELTVQKVEKLKLCL